MSRRPAETAAERAAWTQMLGESTRWEAEKLAETRRHDKAVREQAEQRQREIDDRARQVLRRTPREHIESAARLQATPVSTNQAAYLLAQVQTELLWAQVKQTPTWTEEACDEA